MKNTTTIKKQRYTELQLEGRGELLITEEVKKKIDILHREVGTDEWCGFIFYEKIEGSIADPKTYKAKVINIYPMSIDTSTYTENNNHGDQVLKMIDAVPEYMTARSGFVHSHHSMKAYFSDKDEEELHDNVGNYSKNGSYYLSLVVNFDGNYAARIVKLVEIPSANIIIEEEGSDNANIKAAKETVMMQFDLDVTIENKLEDKNLEERILELKEISKQKRAKAALSQKTIPNVNRNAKNEAFNNWNNQNFIEWEETDSLGEPIPYQINTVNIKKNLLQLLELNVDSRREVGQSLKELSELEEGDFALYIEELSDNIVLMTMDMFGYDKINQALIDTRKELQKYSNVVNWREVIKRIEKVFDDAIFVQDKIMN